MRSWSLAILIITTVLVIACTEGEAAPEESPDDPSLYKDLINQARSEAFDEGYSQGFDQGQTEATQVADTLLNELRVMNAQHLNEAWDEGYASGWGHGYENGYSDGEISINPEPYTPSMPVAPQPINTDCQRWLNAENFVKTRPDYLENLGAACRQ